MKLHISKRLNKEIFLMILLISVGFFLRTYNLNWDQGQHLHPDERLYINASNLSLPNNIQEFFSETSPLNPNMFYYGSFPLYVYAGLNALFPSTDILIISRFVSAILSTFTIILLYKIGYKLFSKQIGLITAFVFTFSPGIIQHAHFNTTESMLIFLVSLITLLSITSVRNKNYFLYIPIGILCGVAVATKITGLSFTFIPFLALIILWTHTKKTLKTFYSLCILGILTITSGITFAPYQIIDYSQFIQEQIYMQGVIQGIDKPPFTIIYEHTLPYVYPIIQVLPFSYGFIAFPISIVGFYMIGRFFWKKRTKKLILLLIILYPVIYFAVAGSWFAKFSRYYILLFPFFSIFAAYAISHLDKRIKAIILGLIAVNGLLFMNIYINKNTRVEASEWIYQSIKPGTMISGEHWDDQLPLRLPQYQDIQYTSMELEVYNQESDEKWHSLSIKIANSDYIIFSSRRVYYSILRNKELYPLTTNFYEKLFEEKLGFDREKTFTSYPFLFSDDFADESFQSYDHPPVYIYKNVAKLSSEEIYNIIVNQ